FQRNQFNLQADDQVFKRVEQKQRGDREMPIDTMRAIVDRREASMVEEIARRKEILAEMLPPADSLHLDRADTSLAVSPDKLYLASVTATRKVQSNLQRVNTSLNTTRELRRQVYKYEVEIQKKYSIPFACIVFVLVGAPLGIRARKGSIAIGVAFSIGFFLLYWVCLIGGEDLADRQLLEPWLAMWIPNILVGGMGLYLTIRTVQETQFFNWERLPAFVGRFFKD
ncbi:MAG TPA: LptF/LptG family permease, partial [Calditrichia bacterium]|nr:LptF/LptG family permease [Calditrichia bacterium]